MVAVKMIVKTGNVQNKKVSRKVCTVFMIACLALVYSFYSLSSFPCCLEILYSTSHGFIAAHIEGVTQTSVISALSFTSSLKVMPGS